MSSYSRFIALVLIGISLLAGPIRPGYAAQVTATAGASSESSSGSGGMSAGDSLVDVSVNGGRVRVVREGKDSYTIELDDLGDIPNLKAILDSGNIVIDEGGDTIRVGGHGRHRSIGRGVIRVDSNSSDRVQVGGSVVVEEGEFVEGDAVAVGGNVTIAGEVKGDAVAVGGNVYLKSTAVVGGEVVCIGGAIKRDEGSEVSGQIVNVGPGFVPFLAPFVQTPWGGVSRAISVVLKLVQILVMVVVAFLVLALWGGRVRAMAAVLPTRPWRLGLIGILGWFLVLPGCLLLLISCIGILFIPVFLALFLFSLVAGLMTVYVVVGERLGNPSSEERPALGTAVKGLLAVHACSLIGTFLGVGSDFLGPFPVILSVFGKVIVFLAATVGLGAVLYTRFGKRNLAPGDSSPTDEWRAPAGGSGLSGTSAGMDAGPRVEPPPYPPSS